MPVEVKELIIRATVTEAQAEKKALQQQIERLKAELLAACRAAIDERLSNARER